MVTAEHEPESVFLVIQFGPIPRKEVSIMIFDIYIYIHTMIFDICIYIHIYICYIYMYIYIL